MTRKSMIFTLAAVAGLLVGFAPPAEGQVSTPPRQLVERQVFYKLDGDRVADLFVFSLPSAPSQIRWESFFVQRSGLLVKLDYAIDLVDRTASRVTIDLRAWQAPAPAPSGASGSLASPRPIADWSLTIRSGGVSTEGSGVATDDDDEGDGTPRQGENSGPRIFLTDRQPDRDDAGDDDEAHATLTFQVAEARELVEELQQFFSDKIPLLTDVSGTQNHVRRAGGWEVLSYTVDFLLGTGLSSFLHPDILSLQDGLTGGGFALQPGPGCDTDNIVKLCETCQDIEKLCIDLKEKGKHDSAVNCYKVKVECDVSKTGRVEACKPPDKDPPPCQFGCQAGEPCVQGCGKGGGGPCPFGCEPFEPCIQGCGGPFSPAITRA